MSTDKPAEGAKPGTAIVSWKEKMLAVQQKAAATEAPKGGFLSFKGGRMSYDDTPIPGDKINVIIVAFVLENAWFKNPYNPLKTESPVCYAMGAEEEGMVPHEDSEEPQHTDCATCPKNEWGSAGGGSRGKACKNSRRIFVIPADSVKDGVEGIKKANLVGCKLPVTSLKAFSKHINNIVKVLNTVPFGVVCELSVTPSNENIFSVNWKIMDQITDEALLQALYAKHEAAEKLCYQPYPPNEQPAQAPAAPAGKTKY